MLEFIKSTVANQSELRLQLNKYEHHRIINNEWKEGSLWIVKTKRGYRVETTGSVGTNLNPQIRSFLRRENDRETVKGYKIWFVENPSDVEKIINLYAKL